jgi:hypothetical protein
MHCQCIDPGSGHLLYEVGLSRGCHTMMMMMMMIDDGGVTYYQ